MPGALEDIRVIDATIARAGPTCIRQLSDWGAEIIQVEAPSSPEATESVTGKRHGSDYQNLQRNKRSICLNLKDPRGRELFYELVKTADVVVENMRPRVKTSLGIDYETLRGINRRIVYGSISGFGQDGPSADLPGLDPVVQGMGGLMSVTGHPGDPMRTAIAISDLTSGMFLATGILAALHERERSGEGQWVKTSLLEALICMLDFMAVRWTVDGVVQQPMANNHPSGGTAGCWPTADGHVIIAAPNNRLFSRMCEAMDLKELLDDPRFCEFDVRRVNREALQEILFARLAEKNTAEWVEIMNAAGVPTGGVRTIDQVFTDPQVIHLGMVHEVEHPALGKLGLIRNAATASRTPPVLHDPAPDSGQHTDTVLAELGLSPSEIDNLRGEGVV